MSVHADEQSRVDGTQLNNVGRLLVVVTQGPTAGTAGKQPEATGGGCLSRRRDAGGGHCRRRAAGADRRRARALNVVVLEVESAAAAETEAAASSRSRVAVMPVAAASAEAPRRAGGEVGVMTRGVDGDVVVGVSG